MNNIQKINQNYHILQKVGEGSFGYVYKLQHRITHQLYALKTDEKSTTKQELQNQMRILQEIKKKREECQKTQDSSQGQLGQFFQFYSSDQKLGMVRMPLYGQNIFNLFHKSQKVIRPSAIYKIAVSMLQCIELLHQLGYIHRDIKPQNFVIGRPQTTLQNIEKNNKIYLIDFGLTKPYLQLKQNGTKQHIKYEIGNKIRGTLMYISINVLLGIDPSRRDDLQSLMYIIILLMKGKLPWQGIRINKKDLARFIALRISIKPQFLFSQLPQDLLKIYIYIRKLQFQERPDYNKIEEALKSILYHKNKSLAEEPSKQVKGVTMVQQYYQMLTKQNNMKNQFQKQKQEQITVMFQE